MTNTPLSATKQALLTIQKLQARIDQLEGAQSEAIAIVGIGCRFPGGAGDPEGYWDMLRAGTDAVGEVPAARWSADAYYHADPDAPGKTYTTRGGFLPEVDTFDPQFFGIAPREAVQLDPQQRLLLEVTWEALEHANIVAADLRHSATGVFVGIISMEYGSHTLWSGDVEQIDAYSGTGSSLSVAAGRLSYVLGLNGPCMALDTACSSSLLAVHLACQSLRLGECSRALAGGVNLMLGPELHINFSKAKMLSPDGRCKTFDRAADGYGRGEGCGMIVLKRLSDALADGDHILAQIKGSAVNHDGASGGLTVPNGPAQERMIRQALENAGVQPEQVSYIEAHGTGTALGDPIEMGALGRVFSAGRSKEKPLVVGSAKTNFGHLEAAAGIAGLIKIVLAMQYEAIPPHLHFTTPSPHIDWQNLAVEIPTRLRPWPAGQERRLAGVSSFGFSGTNIHVVLEEAPELPQLEPRVRSTDSERPQHLLLLSARTPEALDDLAASYVRHLTVHSQLDLGDVCFTARTCRSSFAHRLAVQGASTEEVRGRLEVRADVLTGTSTARGRASGEEAPPVAFLFTGQGAQYVGMGRELYATQPEFRRVLAACDASLRGVLKRPLLEVIYSATDSTHLDETAYTQPALFALECALARMWQSWGIEPRVLMGHSIGEYAAACIAGVFSLEEGLKLVAARGRLMQALPKNGAMVSARASADIVREAIEPHAGRVAIAAINGPQSAVFSGEREAVESVAEVLRARDIETKDLAVSHAFHSPLVEPIIDDFFAVANSISYAPPHLEIISNLTGESVGEELCTPDYWCRHVREPVHFAAGMETLQRMGCEAFVEIGPRPVLLGMGRQCLPEGAGRWLPSLRPQQGDWQQVLHSLGELWVSGVAVDWRAFDKDCERREVALPTYPFQRLSYWVEKSSHVPRLPAQSSLHPLLGKPLQSAVLAAGDRVFEVHLHPGDLELLAHHRVFDRVVLPAAGHVEMALAAGIEVFASEHVAVEDMVIHQALVLPDDAARLVQLVVRAEAAGTYSFQIFSFAASTADEGTWALHTSGVLRALEVAEPEYVDIESIRAACGEAFAVDDYYRQTRALGIEHGDSFQALKSLWRSDTQIIGELELPVDLHDAMDSFYLHPVLLDAAFQMLGVPLLQGEGSEPYLPVSVERLHLQCRPPAALWCVLDLHPQEGDTGAILAADLRLVDKQGTLVAAARGVRFQRVDSTALRASFSAPFEQWLYEVEWELAPHFGLSVGALPAPEALVAALSVDVEQALPRLDFYPHLLPQLEAVSFHYVLRAFAELGVGWRVGADFAGAELAAELGVLEGHRALFTRLLGILAEEGVLSAVGEDHWQVQAVPGVWNGQEEAAADLASAGTGGLELDLLQRCASQLAPVLRGQVDPLQILFPDGDLGPLTRFYTEAPAQQVINELLQKALSEALAQVPDGCAIRVLEIGAGTGGTTTFLLPHLAAERTEYVFTDVSRLFTSKAEVRFADYSFVHCEVLDIERDPVEQGFAANSFDVVVAANVLHATCDIEQTLRNVRSLLAPGGILLLAEGVVRQRWIDLIFGLTEGWWRFADAHIRPEHALLATASWDALLLENGFVQMRSLPAEETRQGLDFPQALIVAQADEFRREPARWLLLADERGTARALAAQLRQSGDFCTLVFAGDGYRKMEEDCFCVNSQSAEDFQLLLRDIDAVGEKLRGVVYCWGLDAHAESLSAELIERLSIDGCSGLLYLLHALGRELVVDPPGLWLVSENSAPCTNAAVQRRNRELNLAQAPLWGMGKIVALEHPELSCVRIDLDVAAADIQAEQLVAQLRSVAGEDQVAVRDGALYVPRLSRCADAALTEAAVLRDDSTYLITGGTGALGLRIAAWMIEQCGVRCLALAGRTPPDDETRARIGELEAQGATIAVLQTDVADGGQVAQLVEYIEAELPPVRGVIHAAGLLDDGVLAAQTPERFARVMEPKVQGAWNLHEHTVHWSLDFFVLFSSATALLGSPGQANYAAANAFLDALAVYRRARDLPALSISWGAWSQIGEAAQRQADAYLQKMGVGSITPEQGLQLLALLLAHPGPQVGAIPIDWSVFSAQWAPTPFFAHLRQSLGHQPPASPALAQELAEVPAGERRDYLLAHAQVQVAAVLGLQTPQDIDVQLGFFDLGMDSLTSIELKNQLQTSLGCSLPATLLFKYPTIDKLVDYLVAEVLELDIAVAEEPANFLVEAPAAVAKVEDISEDELAKLIDAEFEALGGADEGN
ncbi:MAG: acyl transferase domain-containing protein/acyl carrier protein [Candidatus Latescibacterota bacterium]|jgi:acyl transferase domain-containing protein/acyl carrier protein